MSEKGGKYIISKILGTFIIFSFIFISCSIIAKAANYEYRTFADIVIPLQKGQYTSIELNKIDNSFQHVIDYYQNSPAEARVYGRNILGTNYGYSNWKILEKNKWVSIGSLTDSNTYGVYNGKTHLQIRARSWSLFSFKFWGQWIPDDTLYNML